MILYLFLKINYLEKFSCIIKNILFIENKDDIFINFNYLYYFD